MRQISSGGKLLLLSFPKIRCKLVADFVTTAFLENKSLVKPLLRAFRRLMFKNETGRAAYILRVPGIVQLSQVRSRSIPPPAALSRSILLHCRFCFCTAVLFMCVPLCVCVSLRLCVSLCLFCVYVPLCVSVLLCVFVFCVSVYPARARLRFRSAPLRHHHGAVCDVGPRPVSVGGGGAPQLARVRRGVHSGGQRARRVRHQQRLR